MARWNPQQTRGLAEGLRGGQVGKALLLAVEGEGIAIDKVVAVVDPQSHLGRDQMIGVVELD